MCEDVPVACTQKGVVTAHKIQGAKPQGTCVARAIAIRLQDAPLWIHGSHQTKMALECTASSSILRSIDLVSSAQLKLNSLAGAQLSGFCHTHTVYDDARLDL